MSKDKTSREPPKGPWWVRVANFFSNLFKTQDELIREQEIKQLNVYGNDSQVLSRLPKDIEKPEYQEYLIERLTRGSGNIRVGLMKYLVEMEKILDDDKIPLDAEKILKNLKIIIDQVSSKNKDNSEWNLGDAQATGSWERWRQDMLEKINRISGKINDVIKYKLGERVDVDLSVLLSPVNKQVEKEKLFAFIDKGLPVDDNYREQLKTQLASGRNDIVLNIPAYLTREMKKLRNGEVTEGLPERLVKIKTLLEEVKNMPKGADWQISGLNETKSFSSWFTAIDNSIKLLNGMIDKIQPPEQTVVVTQESAKGAPAPVPAQSETGEPESTTQPVAAPRESSRPIQDTSVERPAEARTVPEVNTATGPVETQDTRAEESKPVSSPAQGVPAPKKPLPPMTQGQPKREQPQRTAPPIQSGDTSAEIAVPAPLPAQLESETEEPGSTKEPVAAPRASSRPNQDTSVKRSPGARPVQQVTTASGPAQGVPPPKKPLPPLGMKKPDATTAVSPGEDEKIMQGETSADSAKAEAEQVNKEPMRPQAPPIPSGDTEIAAPASVPAPSETEELGSTTQPVAAPRESSKSIQDSSVKNRPPVAPAPRPDPLARPSVRGPSPTPGQGSQTPQNSGNVAPGRVSTRPPGPAPLPRPSTRTPPTTSVSGPQAAPRTSSAVPPARSSARPGGATPVRRKLPVTAEGQPTPLRESQKGNLPRTSQDSTQKNNSASEPPMPLPRTTQGPPARPGMSNAAKPPILSRTSQAHSRGGQVENLKRERDQKTGEDDAPRLPPLPRIPKKNDPQEGGGSTPTNKQ